MRSILKYFPLDISISDNRISLVRYFPLSDGVFMLQRRQKFCIFLVIMHLLIAFGSGGCSGGRFSSGEGIGKLILSWNANKEPNIAGYKVYYGTTPGKYGPEIDVGNVTKFTLGGLIKGQTYYIAIKAYNRSGQESAFSQEVSGVAK